METVNDNNGGHSVSRKTRVAVLFGGRSAEHEVSVTSARSVLQAIDRDKYDVTMIPITKKGRWLPAGDASRVLEAGVAEGDEVLPALFDYTAGTGQLAGGGGEAPSQVDVVFPLLHGPFGEDGTVQGLLELAGVAYVGSGVLGSAVGMDKQMMRRAFRAEGLPYVEYISVLRSRWRSEPALVRSEIEDSIGYPLFVKPANMGSSVGVAKAKDAGGLSRGMDEASRYDRKIIVEAAAEDCRELECSVLGYEDPEVSIVGEVVPGNEFYDYDAKYIDDDSDLIVPAHVSPETAAEVRDLARRAFLAVEACGLARVDFFVSLADGRALINEINTMPGFTPISMYPKLWEASGVSYSELIDRLIQLALQRHTDRQDMTADR